MTEPGLSAAEAAARLGVKRETLYAYVSRGLLTRTAGPRRARQPVRPGRGRPADPHGQAAGHRGELRTVIATGLTRVDDQRLLVRGRDWWPRWTPAPPSPWPSTSCGPARPRRLAGHRRRPPAGGGGRGGGHRRPVPPRRPADRHRPALGRRPPAPRPVAPQRAGHRAEPDRGPVPGPARADGPEPAAASSLAGDLWCRLTAEPATPARVAALDTALALLVDHGLAGSTFAARIAASVRADPYSVVAAGLAVVGGPLHGAASGAAHELLTEAEPPATPRRRWERPGGRLGYFPGFGHAIYRQQDPRYGALMARVVDAWGAEPGWSPCTVCAT